MGQILLSIFTYFPVIDFSEILLVRSLLITRLGFPSACWLKLNFVTRFWSLFFHESEWSLVKWLLKRKYVEWCFPFIYKCRTEGVPSMPLLPFLLNFFFLENFVFCGKTWKRRLLFTISRTFCIVLSDIHCTDLHTTYLHTISILLVLFSDSFPHLWSLASGGAVLHSKLVDPEVPGSIPGHAWQPSRSEFSVVFSETRVNTG